MPLDVFTTGTAFATWPPKPGAAPQTSLNLTRPRYLRLNFELRLADTATDRVVHSSALKAALLGTEAPQSWVHLCLYGEWLGHPSGPFEFSLPVFNQICANFDAQKNQVPWTIGHPWDTTPSEAWVLQLQIRGDGTGEHDGLYALVEWTQDAAALIRAGKWKFCSVVIDLDATDRKTKQKIGCELIEVGLTNTPFIDGQLPITCSRHHGGATETSMNLNDIVVAFARHLALAPLKFSTVKADAEKEIQKAIAAAAAALSLPKGTSVEKIIAKLTAMGAFLKTLVDGGDDGEAQDAAAMMASPDAAKLAKRIASLATLLAKVKFDAADQAMIQGGDASTGGEGDAGTAQLVEAVQSIFAAAGLDQAAGLAALKANADAIASLLKGGGAPVAADAGTPAQMARDLATQRVQIQALEARDKENSAKLAMLTKERDDAQAAEKLRLAAAVKAEADALIEGAKKDGRLTLAAGKEEGSEVEHARRFFELDHEQAKKWLAGKPKVVPTAPITEGAGAQPLPIPGGGAPPVGAAPGGLDVKTFDFKPKDEAEKQISRTFSARDEATRRRLMVALNAHRSRRSPQPTAG